VTVLNNKIDELKEVTGNRDVSTGGTGSGVTTASAIAALQEAGSKLSRDHIKASYRAFRKVVLMVIELMRQFYDVPRGFRILGSSGLAEFVRYGNSALTLQSQGEAFDTQLGYRLPLFDVQVTAQKQNPYSRLSQNELALQFFRSGLFRPDQAQQALLCLDMMDFNGKDGVIRKVAEQAGLHGSPPLSPDQPRQVPGEHPRVEAARRAAAMGTDPGGVG
jgi:hypothetical protein